MHDLFNTLPVECKVSSETVQKHANEPPLLHERNVKKLFTITIAKCASSPRHSPESLIKRTILDFDHIFQTKNRKLKDQINEVHAGKVFSFSTSQLDSKQGSKQKYMIMLSAVLKTQIVYKTNAS